MSVNKSVLVYLIDKDHVWLGMKKKRYSEGKWNGLGGKVEDKESLVQAAIREVEEEAEVVITKQNLKKVAEFY